MLKTQQYKKGVEGIVLRARTYQPVIGEYIEHFVASDFVFTVRLTNGQLTMPGEAAQGQEEVPSTVQEQWIEEIALSFRTDMLPERKQPTVMKTILNFFLL